MTAIAQSSTRTVERALVLLAAVCAEGSVSLTEAARLAGLPASTALRLLRTLESSGFVSRDQGGAYHPGTRIIQLGATALGRQSLVELAQPSLERIVEQTGESTYLVVRGPGDTALYLAMVEGTHPIRHTSWVGRAIDLADLAVGAALRGDVPPAGFVAQHDRLDPDITAIAAPVLPPGRGRGGPEPARPHLPHRRRPDRAVRPDRLARGRRHRRTARRPPPLRGGTVITFEDVTKRYPDGTVAVDELSLVAPSGEITVFVGPSGCGKTTSLRMINRMIDATGGRDPARRPRHREGQAGPAAPRHRLRHPARRAVPAPHRASTTSPPSRSSSARTRSRPGPGAMELLERVGLDPKFAKRYPAQLSGGQQQRVGVARALAADPPVMLMDEPFSAVDPVVREQLQNEFLRLQGELGKTIVFVTHDIDEAIKLGDKVAVMRVGGKLAQFATPAELLSRPADAFVAGFVGRDRGYRALGFAEAGAAARSSTSRAVRLGESMREARDACKRRLGARRRRRGQAAGLAGRRRPRRRRAGRRGHARAAQPRRHARRRVRHAARGARRRAVLAERARRDRPRRRPLRRHDHRVRGARPDRVARRGRPPRGRRGRADRARRGEGRAVNDVWHYFRDHQRRDRRLDEDHASGWPCCRWSIGLVLALPIGLGRPAATAGPTRRSPSATGILYTIPSLVLFLVLPGILGTKILDPINVAVALTLYTFALLVRVVADGLSSVSADTLAAASAMGYTARQRLLRVQLPMAVPVIGAGLRVAAVSNVSLISVASIIGVTQLGQLFVDGQQPAAIGHADDRRADPVRPARARLRPADPAGHPAAHAVAAGGGGPMSG